MKIKELSKLTNLSISTIRYYEKLKLISPAKKGYYKEYTNEITEQLFVIQKLHLAGLKLADIQALFLFEDKEVDDLSFLQINQIKEILDSSIRSINLKLNQLKLSKDTLEQMLKKVNRLYEACK